MEDRIKKELLSPLEYRSPLKVENQLQKESRECNEAADWENAGWSLAPPSMCETQASVKAITD